ncbi:MAG: hypothetical protein IPJ52_12330 [Rhodocyclaceae bacterium]|nr:hypothetical protein [Rhodocyclaceae bacterium]
MAVFAALIALAIAYFTNWKFGVVVGAMTGFLIATNSEYYATRDAWLVYSIAGAALGATVGRLKATHPHGE